MSRGRDGLGPKCPVTISPFLDLALYCRLCPFLVLIRKRSLLQFLLDCLKDFLENKYVISY